MRLCLGHFIRGALIRTLRLPLRCAMSYTLGHALRNAL